MNIGNVTLDSLQFFDLNNDMILEIFDKINFEDLLTLAEMRTKFQDLIIRYYAINKFHIHEKLIMLCGARDDLQIEITTDSIRIYDNKLFSRILQNFGYLISRIRIDTAHRASIKFIGGQVNKYCSESLTEMSLRHSWN